jgi:hypothetical protein
MRVLPERAWGALRWRGADKQRARSEFDDDRLTALRYLGKFTEVELHKFAHYYNVSSASICALPMLSLAAANPAICACMHRA